MRGSSQCRHGVDVRMEEWVAVNVDREGGKIETRGRVNADIKLYGRKH